LNTSLFHFTLTEIKNSILEKIEGNERKEGQTQREYASNEPFTVVIGNIYIAFVMRRFLANEQQQTNGKKK
jgi:hypothetical protein